MLSKLVCSLTVKQSAQRGMRFAPRLMSRPNYMVAVQRRGFLDQLGLESTNTNIVSTDGKDKNKNAGEVSLW